MIGSETFLPFEEKQKRTPKNNGYWSGERGNSCFYSSKPEMRSKAEYVRYINGEPDFTDYSVFVFEIESMTNDRLPYSPYFKSNYEQSYSKLSEKLGIRESEVKKWLKNNHYTLHESFDGKTIYVVPTDIHRVYVHAGGVAECKEIEDEDEDASLIDEV